MAVHFQTNDAGTLLKNFEARVAQSEAKGKITTWLKTADGVHYTHAAKEWTQKAFFKPNVENSRLTFNIIRPQKANISVLVYAYYHGHLIETFLAHFDQDFSKAEASALPESGDDVSGS